MSDSVSVTSHHSYWSRVWNSFKSILWGILLVIISVVLLARNESNYVKQKAALNEWASLINETTSEQINPDFEWKEVHLYWDTASNAETLTDDIFWVKTDNLKLKRTVEMYQWYEESSESCSDNLWWSEDCTTTYDYHKKRSESGIDSNNFYSSEWHQNPSTREFDSLEKEQSPINLWVYTLSNVFVNQLNNYSNINLNEQDIKIPEKYKNNSNNSNLPSRENITDTENSTVENNNDNYLYGDNGDLNNTWDIEDENNVEENTSEKELNNENFHIYNNYIYIWKDPNKPVIWDLKITFSHVKTWTISIIWKQAWNELTSYTVTNWRSISLLEQWNVSAEDMFLHAQQANKTMTWALRLIWLLFMYCGFAAMLKFIGTLTKVVPFISKIIWVWTGIISLWLTIIVWFVTIWIAWLTARPIVWISCLVIAIVWTLLLKKWNKHNNLDEKTETTKKPETNDIKN